MRTYIEKEVTRLFGGHGSILEIWSWSWKASILLWDKVGHITLLDISKNALKYARYLSEKFRIKNVAFVNANMFDIPFSHETFDLTWNIWTLEHYGTDDIKSILWEMIRVTKKSGYIAFWIPNKCSWPILKASLLAKPYLRWLSGYRLDTENFYDKNTIFGILWDIGIPKSNIKMTRFWSFLPMESPKWLIKATSHLGFKYKFLNFYLIKL